jgi:Histidine kinase
VKSYDLIFSNQPSRRLARHIIFWFAFILYFFYVNLLPGSVNDLFLAKTYISSLQLMIFVPVNVLAVYTALYFLLPRLIYRSRWTALFFTLAGLTFAYFTLAFGITFIFARLTRPIPYHSLPVSFRWFLPVRYGIGFPLTATALVCIFKLFKNYQLEQKEHELLLRQKISNELQLLKTRFQPQFLYHALQKISTLIQYRPAESRSTLLKLSDLLSYILYENEKEQVPLEKELEIIKNFLILKKMFYPKSLSFEYHQDVPTGDLFIPPLLLFSVVENFTDAIDTGREEVHINLDIKTADGLLYFQMECRRTDQPDIGIPGSADNISGPLRRIELLYGLRNKIDFFTENGTTCLIIMLRLAENHGMIRTEHPILS